MPARRISIAAVAVVTVTVALAWRVAASPRPRNVCRAGADAALRACRSSAQADKLLGLGRCANEPDAAAAKACAAATASTAGDAVGECRARHDARQGVCKRLGAAAYAPPVDPANFVATIDNPFFPLSPGTTFVYEGQTADGLEHDEFAVTHVTRVIDGVTCVEVHDTVTVDGTLTEDTLDWFAQDGAGNVWYFGENSQALAGGLVVDLGGSWTAGVDGARPGIVMPASPAVGAFYRQEYLLGEAEDLAEVQTLDASATVPAGTYAHCLQTLETSPLEPDARENKLYAAGVGNVLTIDLETGDRSELVRITVE